MEAPITEKDSILYESSTSLQIGATGMQGWRLEMEDDHITTDMPSKSDHTFLAVFDGHGNKYIRLYCDTISYIILLYRRSWSSEICSTEHG